MGDRIYFYYIILEFEIAIIKKPKLVSLLGKTSRKHF